MADEERVRIETVTPHATRATARGHVIRQGKPPPADDDSGPMSSELLLAALGACTVTTAHAIAAKRRQQVDRIEVDATATFARGLIARIVLDVALHGPLAAEEAETIVRLTERSCTITRALRVPVEAHPRVVRPNIRPEATY